MGWWPLYCHTPWTGPERWGCCHSAWLERCLSSLTSGLWRHSSHAYTHTEHTQLDRTKGNGNETNLNPSLCKDPHPNPKSVLMQNGRDFSVIVQRPGRPCREHDGSSTLSQFAEAAAPSHTLLQASGTGVQAQHPRLLCERGAVCGLVCTYGLLLHSRG